MRPHVDALLTICNDRIVDMFGDLVVSEAFSKADDILCTAAKGIAEIITKPGKLNVDFKDVQTAMTNSGRAIMGTGISKGTDRAEQAVQMALDSPLLDNTRIVGAKHLLVNFTYGTSEPLMSETSKVKKFLQNEAGHTAHLKMGITHDARLGDEIAITVIATGFEVANQVVNRTEVPEVVALPVVEEVENEIPIGITPVPLFDAEEENADESFKEIIRNTHGENQRGSREKALDNMSIPAYLRRNVELAKTPLSDSNNVSKHQITEVKEDTEMQVQKNKFLHDNVD